MEEKQRILVQFMEIRKLMQLTGMSMEDVLDLLLDQLRYYAEREHLEEEKNLMEYPIWVYGQDG